jgi:hypothetical protein
MDSCMPIARPRFLEKLAERLAASQDMADSGDYARAFGYLEQACNLAITGYVVQEVTQESDATDGAGVERWLYFDDDDGWRSVESHPLHPRNQ